jgi:acyl carrier protein
MSEREEIRSFISELLRRKGEEAGFSDSASLILAGRLGSVDAVEIVMFLESRFGVDFATIGFDQAQIDSIDLILELVSKVPRAKPAHNAG